MQLAFHFSEHDFSSRYDFSKKGGNSEWLNIKRKNCERRENQSISPNALKYRKDPLSWDVNVPLILAVRGQDRMRTAYDTI